MENSEIMEPTIAGATCIPFSKSYLVHKIRIMLEATWSKEWQESSKGSHTRKFFKHPSDASVLLAEHIPHELTQILIGHSKLNQYLHRINRLGSPQCCGSPEETVEHYLFHCPKFASHRRGLEGACVANKITFPPPDLATIPKHPNTWKAMCEYLIKTKRLGSRQ